MNLYSIWQRVNRRLPGYDPTELYDEINDAYQEVWNFILQLDDSYFTDIKTVSTAAQANEFDFLYNSNGNLVSNVSNRYFQIDRLRVLQPGDSNWITALPRNWNDPEYLNLAQLTPQQASTGGPYRYILFSNGSVQFAKPLSAGVQIEVVYTFVFLPLAVTGNGTVTSFGSGGTGSTISGVGTNFTSILGADYQKGLPGNDEDTDVGVELVLTGNQTYRIAKIVSDTNMQTVNVVSPSANNSNYQLAMVPDIPAGHHDVIATVATRNVMSTPGNDPRLAYWTQRASQQIDSMRDSVMTRQRQEPPRRRRFSQAAIRYSISSPSR
jgi:hypothetical protein